MTENRSNQLNLLNSLNGNITKQTLKKLDPTQKSDRSAANTSLATPDNIEEEEERWK